MRFLLLLLAAIPALAGSMFDLFPGQWSTAIPPHRRFTIDIGSPESRRMQWTWEEKSKDSHGVVLTGTYKVTAVKDSHHTTFSVDTLAFTGRPQNSEAAQLDGLTVRAGDEIRLILSYDEKKLHVTAFNSELRPVLTRTLDKE